VRYSTLLPVVAAVVLLGTVFSSPILSPQRPLAPPNILRRNVLCGASGFERKVAPRLASASSIRLKMILEKDEDGDRPEVTASAPLGSIIEARATACDHAPSYSRPHLRC